MACADVATAKAKAVIATNLIIVLSIFPFEEKDARPLHAVGRLLRVYFAHAGRERAGTRRSHLRWAGGLPTVMRPPLL